MTDPDIIFITLHSARTKNGVPAVVNEFMKYGEGRLKTVMLNTQPDRSYPSTGYPLDTVAMPQAALNPDAGSIDFSTPFGPRARARRRTLETLLPHLESARVILLAQPLLLTWLIPLLHAQSDAMVCLFAQGDALGTLMTLRSSRRRQKRLNGADHIFAASEFLQSLMVKRMRLHSQRVTLAPAGTSVDIAYPVPDHERARVRTQLGVPHEALVAVCSAPMMEQSGTDHVLRAWPEIQRAVPDAWLILLEGPEGIAGYDEQIDGLDHVVRHKLAADQEKHDAMAACDIFLRPNRRISGGWDVSAGLAFLDAAMCGLPCVGGQTGAAPEMMEGGKIGLSVDGNSVREIATAAIKLLVSPTMRTEMSRAARAFAENRRAPYMTDYLIRQIEARLLG